MQDMNYVLSPFGASPSSHLRRTGQTIAILDEQFIFNHERGVSQAVTCPQSSWSRLERMTNKYCLMKRGISRYGNVEVTQILWVPCWVRWRTMEKGQPLNMVVVLWRRHHKHKNIFHIFMYWWKDVIFFMILDVYVYYAARVIIFIWLHYCKFQNVIILVLTYFSFIFYKYIASLVYYIYCRYVLQRPRGGQVNSIGYNDHGSYNQF